MRSFYGNNSSFVASLAVACFVTVASSSAVFSQTATNNFGASSSFGGSRGFTSYTYRNPQGSNNPTYPNPGIPLIYPTARGGYGAFANQINNTPNTSIPSYSGTSGVPTLAPTTVSAGYSGLGANSGSLTSTTLNLTSSSNATSSTTTNPSSNNAGFNNAGTPTSNTTGIINNFSGIR